MILRRVKPNILSDLNKKMVFLTGPRQCGKTTLAQEITKVLNGKFYSWDLARDRKILQAGKFDPGASLWVFDELHKNRRWRNWLKGIFDEYRTNHKILVTGSGRLDLYGRGGDSLQGRYFLHRLHSLTLSEVLAGELHSPEKWFTEFDSSESVRKQDLLKTLCTLGGFPEPFIGGSQKEADRWRLGYGTRLVQEEVRSLEAIQDLDRVEMLFDRIKDLVGSPISIENLRTDLEVAHGTVRRWLVVLERLYGVFRLPPLGVPKIKAVKKEQKIYYWDWARVEDPGYRFENMIAVHLLGLTHWMEDIEGQKCELRYFRTRMGHEVDFVVLLKGKPWFAIEVKLADRPFDTNLKYLLERVKIPYAFQLSMNGKDDYQPPSINSSQIRVMPAWKFLAHVP